MSSFNVSRGSKFPELINVLIEVPMDSNPVKYEFNNESNVMFVDRFLSTPMHYPANYGFVPETLCGDGDPADVLVFCRYPLIPGSVIEARPVGVLIMEDEKGLDEKILAVPSSAITKSYDNILDVNDLSPQILAEIKHFFEHYKDLEANKWVKVKAFEGAEVAKKILLNSAV